MCIGSKRLVAQDLFAKHGLSPFREALSPQHFREAFPGPHAPQLKLVPEVVFWLMATVALGTPSMAGAVTMLWSSLRTLFPSLPAKPFTDAAFQKGRDRLPRRCLRSLFDRLVERYQATFGERYRWRGMQLLGIDGTDVPLPNHPATRAAFPASGKGKAQGGPRARLVGLVGLWSGVCYDFIFTRQDRSEIMLARRLARSLRPDDLLLADCNFACRRIFAAIHQRGSQFLMRLASNKFTRGRKTPIRGGVAGEHRLTIKGLHGDPDRVLRIIPYQIRGYRPTRLVTSLLDGEAFAAGDLIHLYHERWRHETAYREWKHTLSLNNLRSESASGLYAEALVQVILNNVVRWTMTEATDVADGDPMRPVDLQFTAAVRLLKDAIPVMTVAPIEILPQLYRGLLQEIALCRIRVRPGRHYPRKNDRPQDKGRGRIRQPAKLLSTSTQGES